jgi:bacteriochlorophyllide a dehydrogenase
MHSQAIVFERPGALSLRQLALKPLENSDVLVETLFSGVSTGTEKMLFEGTMPAFTGMAYPLVPGYESVGRVIEAGPESGRTAGDVVFVPGAACFVDAAALFGATADHLVVAGQRSVLITEDLAEDGVALALAATAHHAVMRAGTSIDLIFGHGVLGRLVARIAIALGHQAPQVIEPSPDRRQGEEGYAVLDPASASIRSSCACIIDASGSMQALDDAISRLGKSGHLVLAGFYGRRVEFDFPSAFTREISVSLSSEFKHEDIQAVLGLVASGRLSLKGLVTHHSASTDAPRAYRTAFGDPACLKMVIDWRKAA